MVESKSQLTRSQPDICSCKCKFFCVYRPYKEPISKEMNNNNDLNLHLHDQMSGWLRYCILFQLCFTFNQTSGKIATPANLIDRIYHSQHAVIRFSTSRCSQNSSWYVNNREVCPWSLANSICEVFFRSIFKCIYKRFSSQSEYRTVI